MKNPTPLTVSEARAILFAAEVLVNDRRTHRNYEECNVWDHLVESAKDRIAGYGDALRAVQPLQRESMTDADLAAAITICKMASPGPWTTCSASEGECPCKLLWSVPLDRTLMRVSGPLEMDEGDTGTNADLRFCAAARTGWPAAIAEVQRLRGCLAKANANHEHFEREWYLRGDRVDVLTEQVEQLKAALIEACGLGLVCETEAFCTPTTRSARLGDLLALAEVKS